MFYSSPCIVAGRAWIDVEKAVLMSFASPLAAKSMPYQRFFRSGMGRNQDVGWQEALEKPTRISLQFEQEVYSRGEAANVHHR
ncbi:hypothetical protein [Herbaspirillum sp.]|uniref:hypothetical protein n=1 Tax=Herbaspirillum sp. TaxID=1890675 RepID=UPI001B224EEE|nr:hypothetical protein [Herbaspirillum sp.]MBO9537235.1 hypothetical protein [Herbaspirillum sp.]